MEIGLLQEIKAIIKSLVISSPMQISIDKLNRDFRDSEGYPIPYGKLGFRNLESFLQSISDTIRIHGHGNMATLQCVGSHKSNHIRDMVRYQKKLRHPKAKKIEPVSFFGLPENGNSRSKMKSMNKLSGQPHPLQKKCLEKPFNNRIATRKNVPVKIIEEEIVNIVHQLHISKEAINDYQSCRGELPRADHNCVKIKQDNNSENFQISIPSKEVFDDLDEAVPRFAANKLVFRLDFPENTVIFGKKISSYVLPDNLKKGSVVGLFISEIHNPYKFWFHIYKKNHDLDILMLHIEHFYNSLDYDEFILPSSCHTPGQICAALYNNLWHRAEIIGLPINNKTKVFFIDYGTVSEVSTKDIKYLASIFANIPAQAIRGALSHIKPRGLHWSHEATQYFLSNVCELMLYGQVTEVDEKNRIIYMVICNTNGPEVIQINKVLIENKFALYDENWQDQRIAKNGMRWHHQWEDFPTFEMVERGEYPSFSEIVDLQKRGIDYEKIIDQQMCHGKFNNQESAPEALRNLPFLLLNTNPFRCDIIWELKDSIKII